jgi:hypothetical protein
MKKRTVDLVRESKQQMRVAPMGMALTNVKRLFAS